MLSRDAASALPIAGAIIAIAARRRRAAQAKTIGNAGLIGAPIQRFGQSVRVFGTRLNDDCILVWCVAHSRVSGCAKARLLYVGHG